MRAWKYKRVMSKVIVEKLRLIESQDMIELADRGLNQIYAMLMKTRYGPEVCKVSVDQVSSRSLETAFIQNFVRTCKEIIDYSPKNIGLLLSTLLMKFEVNTIKAILRVKTSGIQGEEAWRYVLPIGRLNEAKCRQILESATSINQIVDQLSDLEYGSILKDALKNHNDTPIHTLLEGALERYVYHQIWRSVEKLRGLDKKIARTVLGVEVDSINIKVLLRCKEMGMNEEEIWPFLLPVSNVFDESVLQAAIQTPNIKSCIDSLLEAARFTMARDYIYLLENLIQQYEMSPRLSELETVLDRGLLKTSLRMLKRYTAFFNIGLILAYLNLKWFELRNLQTIVKGVEENISPERIEELLILPS